MRRSRCPGRGKIAHTLFRQNHRSACSHVQAVFDYLANLIGRKSYAWSTEEAAARQHRPATNIQDGVVLTSRKDGT